RPWRLMSRRWGGHRHERARDDRTTCGGEILHPYWEKQDGRSTGLKSASGPPGNAGPQERPQSPLDQRATPQSDEPLHTGLVAICVAVGQPLLGVWAVQSWVLNPFPWGLSPFSNVT